MTKKTNKRIVLGIQYDGSLWQGWQTQCHGKTIQNIVEDALKKFLLTPIKITCASRTDSGVHALEQIVHFDTVLKRSNISWIRGINNFLPYSIAIIWVYEISNSFLFSLDVLKNNKKTKNIFHARFSAISRKYCYLLYNYPIRLPLFYKKFGWVHSPLNLQRMRIAANYLIGTHNFTTFRSSACQAKSPICNIYKFNIEKHGNFFILNICANSFLQHMVRNIIGSLIMVGNLKKEPEWILELLKNNNRNKAGPTFMADGLYLVKIKYSSKWKLPQQSIFKKWFKNISKNFF
ncbi:tRNA pseudouridine synthase A [Candidatus Profftella armatura]|uniref:tRNA pseudouridine synthase A n=1 Tax=Candidatus Profftella armatura TaxID=669502 RepID=UPI003D961033